ncbi:MAG: hypothetical protein ABUL49_01545, partial [bacterium]
SSLVVPTQYIDGTPDYSLNAGIAFWNYVTNGTITNNNLPGACICVGSSEGFPMMNISVSGNNASGLGLQSGIIRWFDNVVAAPGANKWGSFSDPSSNQNQSTVRYGIFPPGEYSHTGIDSFAATSSPVQPTAKVACSIN